jgi:hypothetical protein
MKQLQNHEAIIKILINLSHVIMIINQLKKYVDFIHMILGTCKYNHKT